LRDPFREQLRRSVRQRRRALTARQRYAAGVAARNAAAAAGVLRPGSRVGVYLSVRGELDTEPLIDLARKRGCKLFVPVIDQPRRGDMRFAALAGSLQANRVGILEPNGRYGSVSGRSLDLVLVPIVAFGRHGERLGTGGGYYDRAFAYLRRRAVWSKPALVGLGYHWQRVDELTSHHWDVPLTAVITDRGVIRFPRRATGVQT
jgi:5-formyltetrahydrofolate cyclo-ligase